MTPKQTAYATLFYEGLMQRLKVESARAEHGENSNQLSIASAQLQANIALAHESIKEVSHELSVAAWQGYLDGVQRFAAVGAPNLPADEDASEATLYQRTVPQLFYDELDGWMTEFYHDLPLFLELILERGISRIEHPCSLEDGWAFFPSIAEGVDEQTGNFGDGFTDDDRKLINEYVDGDITRVAQAVRDAMGLSGRSWPTPDDM